MAKLRIVVGADDAGFAYKEALKADLQADDQVASVVDVAETPDQAFPNVAIAAAEKIAAGERIEPCWCAVQAWEWPLPPTRSMASVP